jgi:hypothetical protein
LGSSNSSLHGIMPATIATLCTSGIVGWLAFAKFGPVGLYVVATFAVATLVSLWGTAWGAKLLAQSHPQLAVLLPSSGLRMALPLVIALVIAVGKGRVVPLDLLYYLVPIYLCMLVADVVVWIGEKRNSDQLS